MAASTGYRRNAVGSSAWKRTLITDVDCGRELHAPWTADHRGISKSDLISWRRYSGDSFFYVHGNACKTLVNDLEKERLNHALTIVCIFSQSDHRFWNVSCVSNINQSQRSENAVMETVSGLHYDRIPRTQSIFDLYFSVSLNDNNYKTNKNNNEIILRWRVSDAINRKRVFDKQKMLPDSVAQSDARLTADQESRVLCLPVQSGNSCLLHTIFSHETTTVYINISIMNYTECND